MYIRHYKTAQLRLTSAAQNINIVISNSGINEDAKISLPPPGRKSDFENLLLYDINKTPRIIILALLDALRTISFKNITVPDLLLRANISKGTFYKYFRDKYHLAEQATLLFANNYGAVIAPSRDGSTKKSTIAAYCGFINENKWNYRMLSKIDSPEFDFDTGLRKELGKMYIRERNIPVSADNIESAMFADLHKIILDTLMRNDSLCTEKDIPYIRHAIVTVTGYILNDE